MGMLGNRVHEILKGEASARGASLLCVRDDMRLHGDTECGGFRARGYIVL